MPHETQASQPETRTDGNEEIQQRLDNLRRMIETNREPDGPIRLALLPSLRASIEVVSALIGDGQDEVAMQVFDPVAKEVKRIIERGY